jgi:protein SCO1/2
MRANRRLILATALTLLIAIAAGAALALRTGGGTSHAGTASGAAAASGPFLTAATMPQGLGGRAGPPFNLANARGGSVASAQLNGRPYVLTFLYVHCVDVCPLIGSEIHDALTKLGPRASDLNVIAVSVDPTGDTRAAVNRWLAVHHEPANFHYLIGSTRRLAPVWKAFYVSPQTPGDPHSTHTAVIWLINRRGRLAALVPAGIPIDTRLLAHDLGVLIDQTHP